MTKLCSIGILLAATACSGGAISVDVAMPRPGGAATDPSGTLTMTPGVIVDAGDGTSVCERIEVKVYVGPSAPTATSAPVASGRGLGTYDPGAAAPRCVVLAANLAPRDDYWLSLTYPGRYFTTGRPDLVIPGQPRPARAVQLGPVKVVDKQTAKLAAAL